MKNLIFLCTFLLLFFCNSTEEEEIGFYIDSHIEFSVKNSDQVDLLNPNNNDIIDNSKIKIFYLVDGVKTAFFKAHWDYPKGYIIFKHENNYRIRVFLNNESNNTEKVTTFIQWNKNKTDKVEATFNRNNNSIMQQKIWLNNEEIWELGNNTIDPYFILTK